MTKKTVPLVLLALILALAAWNFCQWRESRRMRAENARREAALKDEMGRTRKELLATRQQAAAAEAAQKKLIAQAGAETVKKAPKKTSLLHISDFIRDHPEFAGVREAQARRNMLRTYGDLLDRLHLPPDQLEKLKQLLTERQLAPGDARTAAIESGLKPNSAAFRQAQQNATKDIDADISALVGPEQAKALQQAPMYQWEIGNISLAMQDHGLALTPDQTQALRTAMAQASPTGNNFPSMEAYNALHNPDPATGLSPMNLATLRQLEPVLNPAQLAAIREAMALQNKEQAMSQAIFKVARSYTSD